MDRLQAAQQAIDKTRAAFPDGSGNQSEDLFASGFRGNHRWRVTRQNGYWDYDESKPVKSNEARDYAERYPEAARAARVDIAGGGGCAEFGAYVFDILRQELPREPVYRVHRNNLDHSFVIIGGLKEDKPEHNEPDEALVVADPWPTSPRACIWTDHFAYSKDRSSIVIDKRVKGEPFDARKRIREALVLSDEGKQRINEPRITDQEVAKYVAESRNAPGDEGYIWTLARTMKDQELDRNRVYVENFDKQ
ncbi:MAG: hypothetical protein AAGA48_00865 [Myxococcota bacterium]